MGTAAEFATYGFAEGRCFKLDIIRRPEQVIKCYAGVIRWV